MTDNILERDEFAVPAASLGVQTAVVFADGKIAASRDFVPPERRNQFSATKSFTSTAVGMAVDDGLLSLSDRVLDRLPEYAPPEVSDNLAALTLRDCLMMAAGHGRAFLMMDERQYQRDLNWCEFALSRPFPHKPGTVMVYDNSATYLAGVLVQRAAGVSLDDYLYERLFQPLDIPRPSWETSPEGYTFGASSLMLDAYELCRFGVMLLGGGEYGGKRVVSREWLEEATSLQITGGGAGEFGYGYQFWRGRHDSFRADGAFGQLCIVYPGKNAVVAVNSHSDAPHKIIALIDDVIWNEL